MHASMHTHAQSKLMQSGYAYPVMPIEWCTGPPVHYLGDIYIFQINPLGNSTCILQRLYYTSQAWALG